MFVRKHRGLLEDSMKTRKEVKTWKEFIDYYSQALPIPFTRIGYRPYVVDKRISEITWLVGAYDEGGYLGVLGMCSDDPGKLEGYPEYNYDPENVYIDENPHFMVVKL